MGEDVKKKPHFKLYSIIRKNNWNHDIDIVTHAKKETLLSFRRVLFSIVRDMTHSPSALGFEGCLVIDCGH